jgi:hypothetical protein
VPTGTFYKWISELKPFTTTEEGAKINKQDFKAMKAHIKELEMKNEILKKLLPYPPKTLEAKIDYIKLSKHICPITIMCRVLKVNRSTVYKIMNHTMSNRKIDRLIG